MSLFSLNPCFNGILKYTLIDHENAPMSICLNPCFNGILKYMVILAIPAPFSYV